MTSGTKKMNFGTTTGKQKAILNAGMKGGHGGKKGPAAPPMNRNKGHMKGRVLISSRAAEAVLKLGTGIEVQQWRTLHDADKVVLLHPTRTLRPEEPEEGVEPKEGEEAVAVPALTYIKATETLDALAKGFKHLPEPDFVDETVDKVRMTAAAQRILVGEGKEIHERNQAIVAAKAKAAAESGPEAKQLPAGEKDAPEEDPKPNGRRGR